MCDPGYEGVDGELRCVPCDFGYYKSKRSDAPCSQCEHDQTTSEDASTSINDCTGWFLIMSLTEIQVNTLLH